MVCLEIKYANQSSRLLKIINLFRSIVKKLKNQTQQRIVFIGKFNDSKPEAGQDKTVVTTYHSEMVTETYNNEMDTETTDEGSSTTGDQGISEDLKPESVSNHSDTSTNV